MASLDNHTIVGHVGRQPELRYTSDGKAVADFSVAVNNKFRKDDPPVWYKVTVWGKTAEFTHKYMVKGAEVLVIGDGLHVDEWTAQDGSTRFSLVMTGRDVQLFGNRDDTPQQPNAQRENEDSPF